MPVSKKEDRFVQQGDLLNIVRTMRSLLSSFDDARYVINASFDHIDPGLEAAVRTVRSSTSDAATEISSFLDRLEASPLVVEQRKASLGQVEVP
jgi:hypothetical protein